MTSTVTAATMTVKITETIKLNGRDQGAENTISIASVNEVSKRIVTATTTEQIILAFGTAVAAGQFDETIRGSPSSTTVIWPRALSTPWTH